MPKSSDEICSFPRGAEHDKSTVGLGEVKGSGLTPGLIGTGYLILLLPGGIGLEKDERLWRVPGEAEGPAGGTPDHDSPASPLSGPSKRTTYLYPFAFVAGTSMMLLPYGSPTLPKYRTPLPLKFMDLPNPRIEYSPLEPTRILSGVT